MSEIQALQMDTSRYVAQKRCLCGLSVGDAKLLNVTGIVCAYGPMNHGGED